MSNIIHGPPALKLAHELGLAINTIRAQKDASAQLLQAEKRLRKKLQDLFSKAFDEVLREFDALDSVPQTISQRKKLLAAIDDILEDTQETINEEVQDAGNAGVNVLAAQLNQLGVNVSDTRLSNHVSDTIREHVFTATEDTMKRIKGDVMENLAQSYEDGLGIKDAAKRLEEVFEGMTENRTRLIARTEINSEVGVAKFGTMQEHNIQYQQWWTAEDERVRGHPDQDDPIADHYSLHGQIVRVGDKFENGLLFPGDRENGPLEEWINCRCDNVPFIMPSNMTAPNKRYFYEDELRAS